MRYTSISGDLFRTNRNKVLKKLKPDSIALVFSSYQMPRNGDQFFPYRQNSDFYYLTGIEQEHSVLLMCNNPGKEELFEILFIRKPNTKLEIWEGIKLTPDKARSISAIQTIKYVEEFEMELHALLCRCNTVYFNQPEDTKYKPEVPSRDIVFLQTFKNQYPLHSTERLFPILKELRLVKSEYEIQRIKQASLITGLAFERVLKNLKPGMLEYQVEAEITYEFIKNGSCGAAYPTIAASGKNACVLHYIENDCVCREGDLLLLDFGAEYGNYAADLSRTIPINGKFSARQRELYDATLRVFKFARNLMKPGTTINKIHKEVCQKWQEEHIKLGLYTEKDASNNDPDNPLWFNYFMHGTGHFMGLDVHDYGNRETELEPGMIITCEPGLYVANEGIGIRIENDILITNTGNQDIMSSIPIEADDIEAMMNTN